MKFNPEEINLCKQVAEKYRKEINKGDWFICEEIDSKPLLFDSDKFQDVANGEISDVLGFYKDWFPLWTISDCLKFLGKKEYWVRIDTRPIEEGSTARIWLFSEFNLEKDWSKHPNYKAKTVLEACLKAVLAVVEE